MSRGDITTMKTSHRTSIRSRTLCHFLIISTPKHRASEWGGWPTLLILRRFPFRDNGCPVLAFFCKGGNDAAGTMGCYAQRSASHVWGASPALYHLLLLSEIAFSQCGSVPRPIPYDPGTDPPALSVRGRRLCRYAGTHPPAFYGARGRNSLHCDAGVEAAHSPRLVPQTQTERPEATPSVGRRAAAPSFLAGALLRLQCLDHKEARREAAVYASQSGEAGTGRVARTMEMEQLSFLFARRGRAGASE